MVASSGGGGSVDDRDKGASAAELASRGTAEVKRGPKTAPSTSPSAASTAAADSQQAVAAESDAEQQPLVYDLATAPSASASESMASALASASAPIPMGPPLQSSVPYLNTAAVDTATATAASTATSLPKGVVSSSSSVGNPFNFGETQVAATNSISSLPSLMSQSQSRHGAVAPLAGPTLDSRHPHFPLPLQHSTCIFGGFSTHGVARQ